MKIAFTIFGEPASKANSRQLVTVGKAPKWKELLEEIVGGPGVDIAAAVERWAKQARAALALADALRTMFIKSKKARDYEAAAERQIPDEARVMLACPVRVTMKIYYASERPDLDESVVLDVLQAKFVRGSHEIERRGVYVNDRQVREKHVYWGKSIANPRAEILIEPIVEQLAIELPPAPMPADMRYKTAVAAENPF